MSRSTKALAASFALHVAVLAPLAAIETVPWISNDVRPIRVRLQHARDTGTPGAERDELVKEVARAAAPPRGQPSAPATVRDAPERARAARASAPPRHEPRRARAGSSAPSARGAIEHVSTLGPAAAAAPTHEPRRPQALRLEPPADALAPPVELTRPVLRPVSIEPVPIRAPIRATERRMLEAKLEEWTRDPARLRESLTWMDGGREYTVRTAHAPAADAMGLDEAVVTVSTVDGGNRLSTEIRMRRLAFSSFAQLIDRWDRNVQIHDDVIDGRFHSNTAIYVSNSRGVQPVFHGPVTTARGIDTSYSERRVQRDEVFLGGLETRAGRIELPARLTPFAAAGGIDDGERVHRFERDVRITFRADGTYAWRELDTRVPAQRRELPRGGPVYLVGAGETALHVRGVVDGRVLVYSPERIVIEGDLVYAAALSSGDADDYLGLVSDGTVEIAEPGVTGTGDLHVHAAIYAKRRFAVRHYRRADHATLFIVGSLTAGSLTATEPRYRTRLAFDARLDGARPPSYPMTDRYAVSGWDGRWTVEPSR